MAAQQTIPIHSSTETAGCGGCGHGDGLAACRMPTGQPCPPAELIGPQEDLQRVLLALGKRLGFAPQAPEQAGVRALRLAPGEAELQLALPAHCAGIEMAETAFDTLRRLLPDTDIYVTRAG
jgi:hypothetical protein